ncbi:hypothetical protein [Photorhabdus hindustanensis]|uniref:Uncharacterized protein n=1 Tax=Photorhabdus hindustanensis TaxID=2918802 RepID=A0A2S8Q3F7_9GAMM|nr:hypothetical protein [Photorhabdus hindustanensis]PQQ26536.1 hypothetical protein C6H66_10235 [Photorhabdus hindustanensis]
MDELVKKISSYHIFNYLIPGVIFAFLSDELFDYKFKFIQNNTVIGLFFYYFLGSIISRVGSLISPLIDFIFRIKMVNYQNYITAEKQDGKIEVLTEINNMYRSFYSMFLILNLLNLLCFFFSDKFNTCNFLGLLLAFLIYAFSYKKQTGFIVKRVEKYTASS